VGAGSEPRPLTPQQQRAAALIGRGRSQQEVADEVGVTRRTVTNWTRREDFESLAQRERDDALDEAPTARATLEAALTATTPSGAADWRVRVSAARALVGADGPGKAPGDEPRGITFNDDALDEEGEPEPEQIDPGEAFEDWCADGRPEPTPEEVAEWDRLCLGEGKP
jgi:transcriptional regulator with XRE-family HTH domain